MDSSGATGCRIRGTDPVHTVQHAGGPRIDCNIYDLSCLTSQNIPLFWKCQRTQLDSVQNFEHEQKTCWNTGAIKVQEFLTELPVLFFFFTGETYLKAESCSAIYSVTILDFELFY